ncbi:MAG: hypothetical protein J6A38_05960 [Clostridia bacterium]|nr:hypothetical protein [Clostridia bacterium]
MEKFSVALPLTGEYLTTVRLTTGGLCALAGFDVDSTEDFKVCVTESLLILKRNGYLSATMEFRVGESLACTIEGAEKGGEKDLSIENEISRALLSALLGEVDFEQDDDGVWKISFAG